MIKLELHLTCSPFICMALPLFNSACVAGVHTYAKPVYKRHVTVVVKTFLELPPPNLLSCFQYDLFRSLSL